MRWKHTAEIRRRYGVGSSLDHHGIPRRARRAPFSGALLRGLYVDEDLSVAEVAKRPDTTPGRVHQDLARQGIALRRPCGRLKGRGPITRKSYPSGTLRRSTDGAP